MNIILSSQPPVFPHHHESPRQSPQRSRTFPHCLPFFVSLDTFRLQAVHSTECARTEPLANPDDAESPFHNMANRKRKADEDGDGDETMSPLHSPAAQPRSIARPSKKVKSTEIAGRPLNLPRLLETLDTDQLRTVLERICETHPQIGHEVVTQAPRPSVEAALDVLRRYQENLNGAIPYGESSAEYTYYRIKEHLVALTDALADFTPQFLPPTETQPTKSLEFLDQATKLIHQLPDWESQPYRHHKECAYDDISKAWALVINEAGKRAGGFNLHSGGWDQALNRHNEQSGGRLAGAISAMASSVGWMGASGNQVTNDQSSILNQLLSYGPPVRVGPW